MAEATHKTRRDNALDISAGGRKRKPAAERRETRSVRIKGRTIRALEVEAHRDGRTFSDVVDRILTRHVDLGAAA